jgi:hypothetical protein
MAGAIRLINLQEMNWRAVRTRWENARGREELLKIIAHTLKPGIL